MKPTEAEMQERHTLADQYRDAQKKALIDDDIRGIRKAINFLILKERELIAESKALEPHKKVEA
jgi:hypothetical protein